MGAIPIEAEEYPGRPRGDARRSLDGEPCNVEQDERSAAAAAAAAAQQYYYYASQQQQHHQQAPPLAYEEWQELATNLGQLHAGQVCTFGALMMRNRTHVKTLSPLLSL